MIYCKYFDSVHYMASFDYNNQYDKIDCYDGFLKLIFDDFDERLVGCFEMVTIKYSRSKIKVHDFLYEIKE